MGEYKKVEFFIGEEGRRDRKAAMKDPLGDVERNRELIFAVDGVQWETCYDVVDLLCEYGVVVDLKRRVGWATNKPKRRSK